MSTPLQLPLKLEREGDVFRLVDREQFLIATMEDASSEINEEQSAQIIKAVNHHDDLVTALREAVRLMPLGTKVRAEWVDNATTVLKRLEQ